MATTKVNFKYHYISGAITTLSQVLCEPECECSICWPVRRALQSLELARDEAKSA